MRRRHHFRIVAVAAIALAGCSALLDVKDIHLDPNAVAGGQDGSSDGKVNPEGSVDGGGDAAPCTAITATDPKNCGRCGHDCLGGACTAGKCEAVELASITDAPLQYIVETGTSLFVSTSIRLITQAGGIWRVAKAGGLPEAYVTLTYAQQMAVLGDTLYFVVSDNPADDAGAQGGFYSCPVSGPAPCSPTRIAIADNPYAITVEKGSVFYGEQGTGKGIMRYTPPSAPTVFRADYSPPFIYVDGTTVFYTVSVGISTAQARLTEIYPDGGYEIRSYYESPEATEGPLVGSAASVIFTGYDYRNTTGGVVRRFPRNPSVQPCDFGGASNKRPYGLHVDTNRVYWTNQGEGTDRPYVKGSVVSCDVSTCCPTPEVHWTGDGQPTALTGDANALYWVANAKSAVYKLAKP